MTISYHSGERIQATAADFAGTPAISGGWKEVGRTTLGSASNDISVSSLADKKYYMILHSHLDNGTSMRIGNRVNNDSSSAYAERRSADGGSDNTNVNATEINITDAVNTAENWLGVNYIANKSDKEKLQLSHYVGQNSSGAGNAPKRTEVVSKFANTSDAIDRWDSVRISGSGQSDTGSEVVVLGWDETDTHTTNFWEELASVELGSDNATLDSGTFTAKKYLWFQVYNQGSAGHQLYGRVNSISTGTPYTTRYSKNGAADVTLTSQNQMMLVQRSANTDTGRFINGFIINNSANEKLVITHDVDEETSGAGNQPTREESVHKWANTSAQITSIQISGSAGNMRSGSFIKVWGSN